MSWTRERWGEIETVFHGAARERAADRAAFLATACGGDAELRAAVERLLAADAGDAELIDELLDGGAIGVLRGKDPLLRQRFGPFRLIERIADGGMGTVYRAERAEGDFAQPAAVKVLRLGLATERMRERFARERQTLARLLHPNVARLLDGGTTEQGVPFFAMELIDGLPIDRYCADQRLGLRARLQLFATVCRAVHFAHQNLVVHLDLKPSNILVDAHGVPKLVDFGVAGLLREADSAPAEGTRSRPFTPEYASPEQLRGEAVSTAADVYALGVVLYELLTGRRPFEAEGSDDVALARRVCEDEPSRPSTVRPSAAAAERPEPTPRQLRGDLDRIVLAALQKDPARRYASCQQFADDVDRYLGGFPVTAREPSLGYRTARFVRRNRVAVLAAAMVLGALLVGLTATLRMAAIARDERDQADAARLRAVAEMEHASIEAMSSRAVASFFGDTLFSAEMVRAAGVRERLAAQLERRAAQVRRQYGDAPHVRANLLDAIGRAAVECGAHAPAGAWIEEAMAIRAETFGVASLEYAVSLSSLGRLRFEQGRFDDAAVALRECLRLHRTCAVGVHTDVAAAANDLAAAERALGNRERARELHTEALALRRASSPDSVLVAESLNNLANSEDDPRRACALLAEAVAIRARVLGDDDPLTVQSRINLARSAMATGDADVAAAQLTAAIVAARSLGAGGAEVLAQALATQALLSLRRGSADAAATAIDEAVALDRQTLPAAHPRLAKDLELLANVRAQRGDAAGAVAAATEIVAIARAHAEPDASAVATALGVLGRYLTAAGRAKEAVDVLLEAERIHAAAAAPRPADLADVRVNLGDAAARAGRTTEAERALLAALATYEAEPTRRRYVPQVRLRLAALYRQLGRAEDAAKYTDAAPEQGK